MNTAIILFFVFVVLPLPVSFMRKMKRDYYNLLSLFLACTTCLISLMLMVLFWAAGQYMLETANLMNLSFIFQYTMGILFWIYVFTNSWLVWVRWAGIVWRSLCPRPVGPCCKPDLASSDKERECDDEND